MRKEITTTKQLLSELGRATSTQTRVQLKSHPSCQILEIQNEYNLNC